MLFLGGEFTSVVCPLKDLTRKLSLAIFKVQRTNLANFFSTYLLLCHLGKARKDVLSRLITVLDLDVDSTCSQEFSAPPPQGSPWTKWQRRSINQTLPHGDNWIKLKEAGKNANKLLHRNNDRDVPHIQLRSVFTVLCG